MTANVTCFPIIKEYIRAQVSIGVESTYGVLDTHDITVRIYPIAAFRVDFDIVEIISEAVRKYTLSKKNRSVYNNVEMHERLNMVINHEINSLLANMEEQGKLITHNLTDFTAEEIMYNYGGRLIIETNDSCSVFNPVSYTYLQSTARVH